MSVSDAQVYWTGLCEEAGISVDFETVHSMCRGSIIDMNDFMFALKGQPDFDSSLSVLFSGQKFSWCGEVILKTILGTDESYVQKMRLLNAILNSENFELSVANIPLDLTPIYEKLLQQNLLSIYRTCPLGNSSKIDYPAVIFRTPLFASYIHRRKETSLESRSSQLRLETDREIEQLRLETDRKIEQLRSEIEKL